MGKDWAGLGIFKLQSLYPLTYLVIFPKQSINWETNIKIYEAMFVGDDSHSDHHTNAFIFPLPIRATVFEKNGEVTHVNEIGRSQWSK